MLRLRLSRSVTEVVLCCAVLRWTRHTAHGIMAHDVKVEVMSMLTAFVCSGVTSALFALHITVRTEHNEISQIPVSSKTNSSNSRSKDSVS